MQSNLTRRVAFAAAAIPTLIGVVYVGGWLLAGLVATAAVLGAREVYDLAARHGTVALRGWGYAAAVALPAWLQWVLEVTARQQFAARPLQPIFWGALGGALWLMGLLAAAARRGPGARPLPAVAVTLFGAIYAGGLPSFLLVLRAAGASWGGSAAAGTALAMLPLALTWLCDTLAMGAGYAIKGPKLAPALSPQKTWAGAVAGAVAAVGAAPLYGAWVLWPLGLGISGGALLVTGAAVGVAAQVGDVAESLLKREAGVKDTSSLLPGHGGVLDRLDSLYFAVPVATGLVWLWRGA